MSSFDWEDLIHLSGMEECYTLGPDYYLESYCFAVDDIISKRKVNRSITYRTRIADHLPPEAPWEFAGKAVAVTNCYLRTSDLEIIAEHGKSLLERWKTLLTLKHENVVTYYNCGIGWLPPDSFYTFMLRFMTKYSEGTNLKYWILEYEQRKRPLRVEVLTDFFKQLARGLAYLHNNNIVHGSLKPSSVLVSPAINADLDHSRLRICDLDNYLSPDFALTSENIYTTESFRFMAEEQLNRFAEATLFDPASTINSDLHIVKELCLLPCIQLNAVQQEVAETYMEHMIHSWAALLRTPIRSKIRNSRKYCREIWTINNENDCPAVKITGKLVAIFDDIFEIVAVEGLTAEVVVDLPTWIVNARLTDASIESVRRDITAVLDRYQSTTTPATPSLFPRCTSKEIHGFHPSNKTTTLAELGSTEADIWSLGTIGEELVKLAFDRQPNSFTPKINSSFLVEERQTSANENRAKQMVRDWEDPLPSDLEKLLHRCKAIFPSKRITAADVLNTLLMIEKPCLERSWLTENGDSEGNNDDLQAVDLPLPEVIGCTKCWYEAGFKNRHSVGQGSFGTVYSASVTQRCTDWPHNATAVKVTTIDLQTISAMRQGSKWRERKENWRELVKLTHPHLVTYHKISIRKLICGVRVEFMMDYCENGDLSSVIKEARNEGGFQTSNYQARYLTVILFARQIASGLHYLHENDFIHGDLKPGNIFASTALRECEFVCLRIGDLDDALRFRESTSASNQRKDTTGTAPYMSPEMVRLHCGDLAENETPFGKATDVWSLGCVILYLADCLFGTADNLRFGKSVPCERREESAEIQPKDYSSSAFLLKLAGGYYPLVSDSIPKDLKDLIRSCLVPECNARNTAGPLLQTLDQLWTEFFVTIFRGHSEPPNEEVSPHKELVDTSVAIKEFDDGAETSGKPEKAEVSTPHVTYHERNGSQHCRTDEDHTALATACKKPQPPIQTYVGFHSVSAEGLISDIFPALDLLCLAIRHPAVCEYFCSERSKEFLEFLLSLCRNIRCPTNQMLALRVICNIFLAGPAGRGFALQRQRELLAAVEESVRTGGVDMDVQTARATVLLNYALLLADCVLTDECDVGDDYTRLLLITLQTGKVPGMLEDEEARYRWIVALQTILATGNYRKYVKILDLMEVCDKVAGNSKDDRVLAALNNLRGDLLLPLAVLPLL